MTHHLTPSNVLTTRGSDTSADNILTTRGSDTSADNVLIALGSDTSTDNVLIALGSDAHADNALIARGSDTSADNVLIALGSDTHAAAHIQWASQRLSQLLTALRLSSTLWTEDIHGTGRYYMNRLAWGTTNLSADQLQQKLKDIEAETGRTKGRVTIDLDLMQYGDQRYHLSDWDRDYIQKLMHQR